MRKIVLATAAAIVMAASPAIASDEPISPIKPYKAANPAMVELGKKLFFDPRLSKSGFISCNSCHNLSMGGTDNLKTSIGHNWQKARSTPRPCLTRASTWLSSGTAVR